jgi:hypothetical protein
MFFRKPTGKPYGLAAALACLIAVSVPAAAAAQTVAKTYTASDGTQTAMIVQIDDEKLRVSPAVATKLDAILGVVVLPNDAPLSLSENTSERQVYVATTGNYMVLVSDQNGVVKKDDYIAVSSLSGIGMRGDSQPRIIIGKALSGFDGKNQVKAQTKVKDSDGIERLVSFGYVMANINVTRNPLYSGGGTAAPGPLQRVAEGIADKPISPVKAYVSAGIVAAATIIVAVILATGIRSSVTALGRNPLARKNILRNLLQVVLIGLTVFIAALFAVYLLLKL